MIKKTRLFIRDKDRLRPRDPIDPHSYILIERPSISYRQIESAIESAQHPSTGSFPTRDLKVCRLSGSKNQNS